MRSGRGVQVLPNNRKKKTKENTCNECQQLDFFLLSIRSMTFIFCNQPSDFDPKVVIFLVIGDIIIKIVHSMAKE